MHCVTLNVCSRLGCETYRYRLIPNNFYFVRLMNDLQLIAYSNLGTCSRSIYRTRIKHSLRNILTVYTFAGFF